MASNQPSPWWSPSRHADRKPFLMARGAITRAVRAWFDEQGFVEVETGILQVSPGNETHLHAPRTELTGVDGGRAVRYLRTSPEFAAKKLLAAGETKIFEFARVFRDRERGDLHLPEFTMLEWYRANASYDAIMADSVVVIAHAAQATGIGQFAFRGRSADPFAEPELLTVAAAFERFAGIDLLATISGARLKPWLASDDSASAVNESSCSRQNDKSAAPEPRCRQRASDRATCSADCVASLPCT